MEQATNQEMYIKCMKEELAWRKVKYDGIWDEYNHVLALLYNKETEVYNLSVELETLKDFIFNKSKSPGNILKDKIANQYKKPDYGIQSKN